MKKTLTFEEINFLGIDEKKMCNRKMYYLKNLHYEWKGGFGYAIA